MRVRVQPSLVLPTRDTQPSGGDRISLFYVERFKDCPNFISVIVIATSGLLFRDCHDWLDCGSKGAFNFPKSVSKKPC
jgi:hypothetical protein